MTKNFYVSCLAVVLLTMVGFTGVLHAEGGKNEGHKKEVKKEKDVKGKKVLVDFWYEYDGVGAINNPASYTKTDRTDGNIDSFCGAGTARLCSIKVAANEDDDTHPAASALSAMQTAISSAVSTQTETMLIKLRPL